jgi:hypothetical protein
MVAGDEMREPPARTNNERRSADQDFNTEATDELLWHALFAIKRVKRRKTGQSTP